MISMVMLRDWVQGAMAMVRVTLSVRCMLKIGLRFELEAGSDERARTSLRFRVMVRYG